MSLTRLSHPEGPFGYAFDLTGDVLTVNGTAFDLSRLADGDVLPRQALQGAHWLASEITREGGMPRLSVADPTGTGLPPGPVGALDWGQLETTATRLAEARAVMALPRAAFAIRVMQAALVTAEEAEAWADGSALPAVVLAVLDQVPAGEPRAAARIEAKAAAAIHRMHPMVTALGAALGLTDEAVDALFA